ncbi:GNAT family N-acetyltransferase [Haloarcula marina]|uniref:GNAT family N-acetyltransferase n=1 Tax=Haloarcula marina TaxID=2961574 RepID=UPI0032B01A96
MLFPEEIETDRLRLRRLSHETVDAVEYYRLCSRHEPGIEDVTAYLPWDPHETVKETHDYLDELEAKWEAGTRAEYVIRPKSGEDGAGEIAGAGGLVLDWERQTAKPAIWLRKRFWGRGYGGERAAAMLELAFDRLDVPLVAVPVEDGNERSRRAVEKYVEAHGGQYDGVVRNSTVRPDGRVVDHHRYTVTREQYRASVGTA